MTYKPSIKNVKDTVRKSMPEKDALFYVPVQKLTIALAMLATARYCGNCREKCETVRLLRCTASSSGLSRKNRCSTTSSTFLNHQKQKEKTMQANDYRKTREVLTHVHEFLSNLCRDARCDTHCSECIGASDLEDDVYDLLHAPQRNCDLYADEQSAWEAFGNARQGADSSTEEYEKWLFDKAEVKHE